MTIKVPFTAEKMATVMKDTIALNGLGPEDARLIAHQLGLELAPSPLPPGVYKVDRSNTRVISFADGAQYRYNVSENIIAGIGSDERWTGDLVGESLTLLEEG